MPATMAGRFTNRWDSAPPTKCGWNYDRAPLKKWTLVDRTLAPDGTTISLYEHDGDYTIRAGAAELMSTRRHASEEKVAELACHHVRGMRGARVLVGGLGFGHTLKAALSALPAAAAGV